MILSAYLGILHTTLSMLTCQWQALHALNALLRNLQRSAWQRPQTQCSSGLCRPRQRERRGSHKHSGCVHRPSRLPSQASKPHLSPWTPSLHCWQTHYVATCGSQSCGSPLMEKKGWKIVVSAGVSLNSEIMYGTSWQREINGVLWLFSSVFGLNWADV